MWEHVSLSRKVRKEQSLGTLIDFHSATAQCSGGFGILYVNEGKCAEITENPIPPRNGPAELLVLGRVHSGTQLDVSVGAPRGERASDGSPGE